MPRVLIQRIIDELDSSPKSIAALNVGVSGVYLRSAINAMVELGMIYEHHTWPRTYSLKSTLPDPVVPSERATTDFDLMFTVSPDTLDRERVTQHIVSVIRMADPETLAKLREFMTLASAKITDELENLEPVSIEDINVIPLKRRK